MINRDKISDKTIGRLSQYRRFLNLLHENKVKNVFSYQIANSAGVTSPQVRRDVMLLGYNGNPAKGYNVEALMECLAHYLDTPGGEGVVLVGFGNLGRALISYFSKQRPNLSIVAVFDNDPALIGRVIHGVRCCSMEDFASVAQQNNVRVGILAVPADQAQLTADLMVAAGINGILNFALTTLQVPPHVYVERVDITTSVEKVVFFARKIRQERTLP
ncbi:MAG TPA: redox-sensing transcriptional repressor Rex [Elusimicrobiota bacterium]|nr:redox-sensing transcriptional repressor Rex [Elusimicrobiota bacterium]